MPYFPPEPDLSTPYQCQGCQGWYRRTTLSVNTACLVSHSPGSCCHYGEWSVIDEAIDALAAPEGEGY